MRHNNVERQGVNAVERIFVKDFEWIFRDQPYVDVGIDALVEQVLQGYPTGKILALQIKSGKGNFHISNNKITYYVSNVHHEYWSNYSIPVILIAYFPEEDKAYWKELNSAAFKRTGKKWKVEINLQSQLRNAKTYLEALLESSSSDVEDIKIFDYTGVDEQTIFDLAEETDNLHYAVKAIFKSADILEEFRSEVDKFNLRLANYQERNIHILSPQGKAAVKSFARTLNLYAKRLDSENLIFAEVFGKSFYAFHKLYLISAISDGIDKEVIENIKVGLNTTPDITNDSIRQISFMRENLAQLPDIHSSLKQSKQNLDKVLDSIIQEYKVAATIMADFGKTL